MGLRKLLIHEDGLYTYESYPDMKKMHLDDSYLNDFLYAVEFSSLDDALLLLDRLLDNWYTKDNQGLYYYMTSSLLNALFQIANKDALFKEIGSINSYYQTLLETKSLLSLKESLHGLTKQIK